MKHWNPTLLLSLLVPSTLALGCERHDTVGTAQTTATPPLTNRVDNTAVNARDISGAPTPMDQGEGRADLETTQHIRQALMADDSLSLDAKNIKVITKNGTVTLRGPVKSREERASVEAKAWHVAGLNDVDDRLDIESTK
jgi:hyperosmotically inducible protein